MAPQMADHRRLGFATAAPVVLAAVTVALAVASPARAAPASLSVTNDAQPGLASSVPQAAITVGSRGSCASLPDVAQANGAPSPCPAGTWPTMGASWGPQMDVAAGDTLRLTLAAPAQRVRVSSTTNYPVGLTTPPPPLGPPGSPPSPCFNCNQPIPNVTMIAPEDATATADPSVWLVTVPTLPYPYGVNPVTVAIVASDATGASDFALMMSTPRWDDESTHCSTIYGYAWPGPPMTYSCPGRYGKGSPPLPPAPNPAPSPPGNHPRAKGQPRAIARLLSFTRVRRGIVNLRLRIATGGALVVRLSAARHELSRTRLHVSHAQVVGMRLSLSAWALRRLRRGPLTTTAIIAPRRPSSSWPPVLVRLLLRF